jgi:predicted hydrocarbon binding protein
MDHMHRWIAALVRNLDECVDEKTRTEVLENCGRSCTPRTLVEKAKECKRGSRDVDEALNKLHKVWSHFERKGDNIEVTYEKCYCSLVNKYPGNLPRTWCSCSKGWIKELFEPVLGRPVNVLLVKSVKQGDNICKFRITL